jgi:hypothetical protein
MTCPVACPLAWSDPRRITCSRGRYRADVPTNDCLSDSAESRVDGYVVGMAGSAVAVRGRVVRGWWGVVSCPSACPLAWPSAPLRSPLYSYLLPAKERQNGRRQDHGFGGGL